MTDVVVDGDPSGIEPDGSFAPQTDANGSRALAARPGAPLLEVRNLSVAYATDSGPVVAVDNVDLDLTNGEFLAVVGESGCGKSTLLFAIAQLLSPPAGITAGSVLFRGRQMVDMGERQLRHIRWSEYSVVMQSAMNALNPVMTVAEQMRDACVTHAKMSKEEIAERSAEVLRLVSIDPVHLGSYPHQLSGGMRQRAMIAMALLFTPQLVIMDEPTSALDVVAQRSLMRQIKELQERLGFAVIFVTHDMSLVSHFSDRLMVMYAGEVAEIGATKTLFATPRHPYSRGLLEAFPSIRGPRVPLTGIAGFPPDLASPPKGCRFQPRCADAMAECVSVRPPLFQRGEAGEALVRCLLYKDPEAGAGSLAGAARRSSNGAGELSTAVDADRNGAAASLVASENGVGVLVPEMAGGAPSEDGLQPDGTEAGAAPASPKAILEAVGLTRYFKIGGVFSKKLLHAVEDVSFTINRKEIVALVGESGSGKSTVARLLAMAYKPTAGEIRFDGKNIAALRGRADKLKYRGAVPMVFQDPYSSMNPAFRVSHGIKRAMDLHRPELDRAGQAAEAIRVMEAVGLTPASVMLAKYPYELSGGQRQRVGFAQALVLRPKVILADEPVSMLDVSIRVGLLNLMTELREREGVSFLYITHDIASARYVADRLIVMYAGHVVEEGRAEDVLTSPRHPYTQLLVSAVPDPRAPLSLDSVEVGEPPKVVDPQPGCRFAARCPYVIERCGVETPLLRTVARAHVAACHVAEVDADVDEAV